RIGGALVALGILAADAAACPTGEHQRWVFFRSVPSHLDAPVIAQATVTKLTNVLPTSSFREPYREGMSFEGEARVDSVIKGVIESPTIMLVAPHSSCDVPFFVGASGIVLGRIRRNLEGMVELRAISDIFRD